MKTSTRHLTLVLALAAAIGATACDDVDPTGDDTGSVSLLLTDAPGDFATATVTIERIELMRSDSDDADEEDAGGRVLLRDEPYTGNLLDLVNEAATLVDDVVVPGGAYSQLRFVISGGCIEVETETGTDVYASGDYDECGPRDGSLQMPSFEQSGLKVNLPAGFRVDGDRNIVLVDFDVAQSFGHQAGNSGRWVMHPVVHATEIEMSGGIDVAVTVADSVELPAGFAVDSLDVRLGSETPIDLVDGGATLQFLVPGTFTVDLVAPQGFTLATEPALPVEVDVASGADVALDIVVTGIAIEE